MLDHKTSISAVSGSVGGAAYVLRPDGTTKRRPVYGKSEEIVRGRLTELQANSDQGIPADATGWTVEWYLTVWLAQTVKPNRQPNTYVTYEKAVRIYLVPGLGRKRLNRLTGADVRQFVRRTESTCRCCVRGVDKARPEGERRCCAVGRCCRRLPSKRQVQVVHAVLRNALQAAVREELVRRNVAKLVQVSTPRYNVDRGLTVEQAHQLLDGLYALLVLALSLGMRRGELLGLQWSDLDSERETLTVRHTLLRVGGELRLCPPKTEDSERTLPVTPECRPATCSRRRSGLRSNRTTCAASGCRYAVRSGAGRRVPAAAGSKSPELVFQEIFAHLAVYTAGCGS
ncbi:tyrosine recombinase XerC [Parafrankia sp. BMG5.11]|uniref:site-specific integrase n=1 Tax=Parafrankia sp. BMG5.11 TaxID=222540 RepID=UPI00359F464B